MQQLTDIMDPTRTRINLLFRQPQINMLNVVGCAFPTWRKIASGVQAFDIIPSAEKFIPCFPNFRMSEGCGVVRLAGIMNLISSGGSAVVLFPEAGLHPAWQVGLGDMANLASKQWPLIFATDSEYMLLRILRRIRETESEDDRKAIPEELKLRHDEVCCVYVQEDAAGRLIFDTLPITSEGDFARPWPDGFFDERTEELFQ